MNKNAVVIAGGALASALITGYLGYKAQTEYDLPYYICISIVVFMHHQVSTLKMLSSPFAQMKLLMYV